MDEKGRKSIFKTYITKAIQLKPYKGIIITSFYIRHITQLFLHKNDYIYMKGVYRLLVTI